MAVVEAAPRLLSKVAITGGGRCNLTNSFAEVKSLESVYPRGARLMKRLFKTFDYGDAYRWFESEGVRLTTQSDQCVFPVSQNAMQIVDCLIEAMRRSGVEVSVSHRVSRIVYDECTPQPFTLHFSDERQKPGSFERVLATTGGSPKLEALRMFAELGLSLASPVPSLFSFCIPDKSLTSLMGTVVENAAVRLAGTKIRAEGALLLTHWGMSGPAVLKLSSHAARILAEQDYKAQISVNWSGNANEEELASQLWKMAASHPQKQLSSVYPEIFNARLWLHLLRRAGLQAECRWNGLERKGMLRLCAVLTNDVYVMDGKNRFKDEFVTCGGIALPELNPNTLEARNVPGLFFAGELLDVDAVTGGFNLQAAWTTGFVAASHIL